MASIEGYAEHVMDAAAPRARARTSASSASDSSTAARIARPLARLLAWLLGMELKLRQYRDGKRFCDGVVELDGIAALNAAWAGPGPLPTLAELADPGAWLQRTGAADAAVR